MPPKGCRHGRPAFACPIFVAVFLISQQIVRRSGSRAAHAMAGVERGDARCLYWVRGALRSSHPSPSPMRWEARVSGIALVNRLVATTGGRGGSGWIGNWPVPGGQTRGKDPRRRQRVTTPGRSGVEGLHQPERGSLRKEGRDRVARATSCTKGPRRSESGRCTPKHRPGGVG